MERRELLKKAAYVAPAILTLKAIPAFASRGSGAYKRSDYSHNAGSGWDLAAAIRRWMGGKE